MGRVSKQEMDQDQKGQGWWVRWEQPGVSWCVGCVVGVEAGHLRWRRESDAAAWSGVTAEDQERQESIRGVSQFLQTSSQPSFSPYCGPGAMP